MSCLSSISPFQFIIIGALLIFLISGDRDAGELNVFGNIIVTIGGLILTVAAQKEFLKTQQEAKDLKEDIKRQIKDLQEKIDKMN